MVACWLLGLSALFLLLFLHPYIFYPASLRLFRARSVSLSASPAPLRAALFFCAHNEARALPAKLRNLEELKARHPDLVIYAYDDMSTDSTRDMLAARPDLLTLLPASERTGKARGMGHMVEQADCDICIFTDANVMLDPGSIDALLRLFGDPEIGGVSGKLLYVNADDGATAQVGGLYWRLEERIKTLESRCGSMMGADGSIFAVRRSLYPYVPPHLLDDMTVSMTVPLSGLRLISGEGVIAYERSTTSRADEFRRKRRIACRSFNTHRYLWPRIKAAFGAADLYKYISHKLMRWFGAPLLLAAIICFSAGLALAGGWLPLVLIWTAGMAMLALGAAGIRLFSSVYEILLSIMATWLGVMESLSGKTYQTWAPATSRD